MLRNHLILLFLALEAISFYLVVNYNNYQRVKFLSSANYLSSSIYRKYSSIVDFFSLGDVNARLAEENAKLRTALEYYSHLVPQASNLIIRLPENGLVWKYQTAKVINNSTNRKYNYLTLDKGRKNGVVQGQGVANENGVVGIIVNVSESYSVALSLLNPRWSISAKLKRNNYFGSLLWEGGDYRYADLKEIPFHVPLNEGDTIVTSGYSSVFPEGIRIGTIDHFSQRSGGSFYDVRVKLSTDFKTLSYVNIISNPTQGEINSLERISQNE